MEKGIKRGEGEITHMLMINRVELALVDHVFHIRHFNYQNAIVLEGEVKAANESIKVCHVREDVMSVNKIGLLSLGGKLGGQLFAEKLAYGRYVALRLRDARHVSGRLNPEDRDPRPFVILEKIAVITGDFHNQALVIEAAFFL